MSIEIKQLSGFHLAYVHHIGPYQDSTKAWQTLFAWAEKKQLLTLKSETIGISYDDPSNTLPQNCRYDACLVVPENTQGEDEIHIQQLPQGTYLCYQCKTKLQDIPQRFIELYQAIEERQLQCIGIPFEYYPSMLDEMNQESKANSNFEWTINFCTQVKEK